MSLRSLFRAFVVVAAIGVATPAWADLTVFTGTTSSPAYRPAFGVSLGLGFTILGVEFEYSDTRENLEKAAPNLRSGSFNLLIQTPMIGNLQFYGTTGLGLYRERLVNETDTGFGSNVGGGVKLAIGGPVRIRFDYRVFRLGDGAVAQTPQRFYVGLNLGF